MAVASLLVEAEVEGDAFRRACRRIEPAVRDAVPGQLIRVAVVGSDLFISAFDGEVALTGAVPAQVVHTGETIVRAKPVLEFVRTCIGQEIEVKATSEELHVVAGAAQIIVRVAPDSAWQSLEHLPPGSTTWPTDLTREVGRVLHAAHKDASRGAMHGVSLAEGHAVATDGFRIAAIEVPLPDGFQATVPTPLLEALLRARLPDSVAVTTNRGVVTFESPTFRASSRQILTNFPDWRSVLPAEPSGQITLDRLELLAGLARMAFLTKREELQAVEITRSGSGLRIAVDVRDVGRQEEPVAGNTTIDTVRFGASFLRQAAEQMYHDEMTIRMDGPLGTAVIQESPATAVLMPIRT